MSNARTIAKNTGWYGLENIISSIITVFTSIAIARTLGPSKMGYMIYVMWIATVVSSLGSLGIPAATSKYMAEFLGKQDRGPARFIYFRTLFLQVCLASVSTIVLLAWVKQDANAEYRRASILIVLSIWPTMVNFISAQANAATEQLEKNLPASIASTAVFLFAVVGTLVLHLGIIGVAASFLIMRIVDFTARLVPTMRRIESWEKITAHPADLSRRMTRFAVQSVATLIIALIVWNRSEVVLLRHLCFDIRQVAFYSVAFSLADRLLIGSSVFASSTSTTMFAQYGRDQSKLASLAASSFRYLALTAIPVHCIATALAAPALLVFYGDKYLGAAAAVTLAPLLCMPKAFLGPVQSLLQSTERQSLVISSTIIAGIVDIGIAWWLIPIFGAVGACFASGAAQVIAIGSMWGLAMRLYHIRLPWRQLAKICAISVVAALIAHFISIELTPVWGVVWGGAGSLLVLLVLIPVMRVMEPEDHVRFRILTSTLPKPLAAPLDKFLALLGRPELAGATSANG
jgi:O-antigen/teichoic acid export membrane protein